MNEDIQDGMLIPSDILRNNYGFDPSVSSKLNGEIKECHGVGSVISVGTAKKWAAEHGCVVEGEMPILASVRFSDRLGEVVLSDGGTDSPFLLFEVSGDKHGLLDKIVLVKKHIVVGPDMNHPSHKILGERIHDFAFIEVNREECVVIHSAPVSKKKIVCRKRGDLSAVGTVTAISPVVKCDDGMFFMIELEVYSSSNVKGTVPVFLNDVSFRWILRVGENISISHLRERRQKVLNGKFACLHGTLRTKVEKVSSITASRSFPERCIQPVRENLYSSFTGEIESIIQPGIFQMSDRVNDITITLFESSNPFLVVYLVVCIL